jgi:hypothetical protein
MARARSIVQHMYKRCLKTMTKAERSNISRLPLGAPIARRRGQHYLHLH